MSLESNYIRELNRNYLVVSPGSDTITESFEIEMVKQNKIQGLLEFDIRHIDGRQMFIYEISSKQSIKNLYASTEMNFEMIAGLVQSVYHLIHATEEYLIDMNHILIDPEYIFIDIEKYNYYFVFFPELKMDAKDGFIKLSEYILDKVDHKDEKAVLLAYRIYKNTRSQNFKMEEIISFLHECAQKNNFYSDQNSKCRVNDIYDPQASDFMKNAEETTVETTVETKNSWIQKKEKSDRFNENSEDHDVFLHIDHENQLKEQDFITRIAGIFFEKTNLIYISLILILLLSFILTGLGWYLGVIRISRLGMIKIEGILLLLLTLTVLLLEIKVSREKTKSVEEHCNKVKQKMDHEEFEEAVAKEKVEIKDFLIDNDFYKGDRKTFENGDTMLISFEKEEETKGILSGKIEGREETIELNSFPFTIGKLSGNVNLELADHSVSRMHARFYMIENQLYLEDLNSLNGTFKNGVRLNRNEPVMVQKNDEIEFAKIKFTYH